MSAKCQVSNSRSWWSFYKVQPLTQPITEMDALMLNYWLSKFVQELPKCSKDLYPPKKIVPDCLQHFLIHAD